MSSASAEVVDIDDYIDHSVKQNEEDPIVIDVIPSWNPGWCIAVGSFHNGFSIHGPFNSEIEALQYRADFFTYHPVCEVILMHKWMVQ